MSKHDGATICLREGGLNYFEPELVDSFVENKNSDMIAFKIIACSFDPHSPFDKLKTLNYVD
jgi:response regulator RpfG family c-di-GMP phosphodiesterase